VANEMRDLGFTFASSSVVEIYRRFEGSADTAFKVQLRHRRRQQFLSKRRCVSDRTGRHSGKFRPPITPLREVTNLERRKLSFVAGKEITFFKKRFFFLLLLKKVVYRSRSLTTKRFGLADSKCPHVDTVSSFQPRWFSRYSDVVQRHRFEPQQGNIMFFSSIPLLKPHFAVLWHKAETACR
jgi:hypothetical protein